MVAAICVLPKGFYDKDINDSKKVSPKKREELYKLITSRALYYNTKFIYPQLIDKINIKNASIIAFANLINFATKKIDIALIDAEIVADAKIETASIIKGDEKSLAIAAASIIAKVTRDRYMQKLHTKFPIYDFASQKGYGTNKHVKALNKYGPIAKIHRFSYEPVRNNIKNNSSEKK
jgi:ribonuclease HII